MKDVRVRVIRSHISGPGQVSEVGEVLVLPEHVATLRINVGQCELLPPEPPAAGEATTTAPAVSPPPAGAAAPSPATEPTAGIVAGLNTTDVPSAEGAPAPPVEGSPVPDDPTQPAAGVPAPAAAPDPSTTTAAPAGSDKPAAGRRGNRP